MQRSCAVKGCEDKKGTRHRFPNPCKDRIRYNKWVELTGNAKLYDVEPMRVYENYRVCHSHFTDDSKSANMYIKRTSLPSLLLPGKFRLKFTIFYDY